MKKLTAMHSLCSPSMCSGRSLIKCVITAGRHVCDDMCYCSNTNSNINNV